MSSIAVKFFGMIESFPKPLTMLIVITVYAASQIIMFPGTPINIASGFLSGFWLGSLSSLIGCELGSIICFLLGRTLLRKWVENKTKTNEKFRMIDEAIATGNQSKLIIFLVRLSPFFPFALCSFFFGVTRIKFVPYCVMTFLGLLPFTVAYTYFGTLMKDISEIATKKVNPTFSIIILVVGSISVVAISIIIGKIIANIIKKAGQQATSEGESGNNNSETLHDKVLGDAVYIEMLDDVDSLSENDEYAASLAKSAAKQNSKTANDDKNNSSQKASNTEDETKEDTIFVDMNEGSFQDSDAIPILEKDAH